MITFLPVPQFAAVARLLDDKRLGSQRVEALFILRCVRNVGDKYRRFQNAGYVRMWIGYAEALAVYYNEMTDEWLRRGFSLDISSHDDSVAGRGQGDVPLPAWLGDDRLHATHRAALLFKDPEHYGQLGWTEEPVVQYLWPQRLADGEGWSLEPPKSGQSKTSAARRAALRALAASSADAVAGTVATGDTAGPAASARAPRVHWMSKARKRKRPRSAPTEGSSSAPLAAQPNFGHALRSGPSSPIEL